MENENRICPTDLILFDIWRQRLVCKSGFTRHFQSSLAWLRPPSLPCGFFPWSRRLFYSLAPESLLFDATLYSPYTPQPCPRGRLTVRCPRRAFDRCGCPIVPNERGTRPSQIRPQTKRSARLGAVAGPCDGRQTSAHDGRDLRLAALDPSRCHRQLL